MNAQLYQVFLTYARRPILLLMGAVAAMLAVGMFVVGLYANTGGNSIAPDVPLMGNSAAITSADWKANLAGRQPSEFDRLFVNDPLGAPPADLAPFTHATTIKLISPHLTAERIAQLAALQPLQNLEIQSPNLPEGAWSALGPKLRLLEIPARLLVDYPQEVSQLEQLEVLRIDRSGLSREAMSVIAQIPNLKYLVLTHRVVDYKAPKDAVATLPLAWDPAQLAPLQNHPHLQAIFMDWPGPPHRTTPALPGVTLYAASFSYALHYALQLSVLLTAALSVIVTLQTWAHFTTQQSVIIPGYHRRHRQAALLVLLGGSFAVALLLWNAQFSLLPALAIALVMPSLIMTIYTGSQARSPSIRMACVPLGLLAGTLIWLPWFGSFASPIMAGETNWFFRGATWWWAVGLLAGEVVLLTASFRQLPRIAHQVYEQSSMHPGFSPWDPQQQRRVAYGSQHWWQSLWSRGRRFPKLAGSSVWRQAQLWKSGNAYRPLFAFPLMGATFLVVGIGMSSVMPARQTQWPLLIGFLFQFSMITLLLPVTVWYRRCRTLQVESLRPAGKKDLTRQLFVALALDQAWAIIPMLLGVGYLLAYPEKAGNDFTATAIALLLVVALAWGYATSTSIFAIQRLWVLLGYFLTMFAVSLVLGIGLTSMLALQIIPMALQIPVLSVVSLVLLMVAAGIIRATYAHAVNREWGL
ncbi:hypothetical protein [Blastopirellula marina]|uniref:Uncharacterized protein n=1 Tax=Blastopirellula marina DSM 3645 TaxID=314230 RepID=A3ZQJ5_9BACT|nr:hypothetical protein [Blastopirellula marina]EAQ81471.1 hypothetical protein DSM3645_23806 [Blastopirellula marina DSM 3645]